MVIPCFAAPFCYICDEFQRKWFTIWQLQRTLACFVILQPVSEMHDCFISGEYPDMVFKCCEMDYVVLPPVSRHAPGYSLLRIRQYGTESFPYLYQKRLDALILCGNILIDRFRKFAAKVTLVLALEPPQAFGTLPHINPPHF